MSCIWHPVDARSEEGAIEWKRLRLGVLGSSEFHRVITPGKPGQPETMKLSKQALPLMYRLLAERITGQDVENYSSQWMDRGVELEDQAVRAYENFAEVETTIGGFFLNEAGTLGCSPDRLIGAEGDLEIKCPLIQTQIAYALEGLGDDYKLQLQGRMMLHGRPWIDVFSYHPLLFLPPVRVYRDEKTIAVMRPVLETFAEQLVKAQEQLEQKYGPFAQAATPEPPEESDDFISDEDLEAILKARS